jgi:hypothetical protein
MGPYELPSRLSGASYLHLLTKELYELLEHVQLETPYFMWFMHAGDPTHLTHDIRSSWTLTTHIDV